MSINRITGIATGMDTDKMVKDLLKIEQMKIDKADRAQTRIEGEQEAYRDVIKSIKAFQDEYFDLLKPQTNFRSVSAFSEFNEKVTVSGEDVNYLSITGTAGIKSYEHTVSSITQLATEDEWTTDATGIGSLKSNSISFGALPSSLEFSLTIDGNTKTVSIADTSAIADSSDLATALNDEIKAQFGNDYSSVVTSDAGSSTIAFRLDGSEITIMESSGHESNLSWLGYTSGESTSDYEEGNLNLLFGITNEDLKDMTINGTSLSDLGITRTSTLKELTDAVSNSGDMNVELLYMSTSDTFTLKSDDTGSANNISLSAEFMNKLGFIDDVTHRDTGKNAILELDGTTIVKSANTFTIDGLQYTVNETYDGAEGDIDLSVDKDTEAIVDKIKKFVETYNGLISEMDSLISEKRDYDFEPLTDEEKEALSEDDIEKYEERAKKGILGSNKTLNSILTKMRTALYESVDGVDISLSDIGIQTTADYKAGGILVIDEDKLTEAVEKNYEEVISLFTNKSDQEYLDSENASERYSENGLANRLYDIIQDNIRTVRDSNGYKGTLLEKAGIEGDVSLTKNLLTEKILEYEEDINDMWDSYYDKENTYYMMFAKMESALSEMQSQADSLLSQLG